MVNAAVSVKIIVKRVLNRVTEPNGGGCTPMGAMDKVRRIYAVI